MKIYARWGLAAFAGFALAAVSLAADVTYPMPGQAIYGGGQPYYGPGYGPGCYGPMNNGCGSCGQAYGWPPPGSQPFGGYQGPLPSDCGGGCGRGRWCHRNFSGQCNGNGGNGGNGQVPTTAAFPTHPFARSPRDYFMMDQPCMGDRPCP